MKRKQTLGVVRHVLTFAGGFVVMKGFASDSVVQEIIGTVLTLVGSIWSVVNKQEVEQ